MFAMYSGRCGMNVLDAASKEVDVIEDMITKTYSDLLEAKKDTRSSW
jgi:hypothetical protein